MAQVLVAARSTIRPQTQRVSPKQVGSFEQAIPDVVNSPDAPEPQEAQEFEPAPPILRTDISCDLKILLTNGKHAQLNNFELFLASLIAFLNVKAISFDIHIRQKSFGPVIESYTFSQLRKVLSHFTTTLN